MMSARLLSRAALTSVALLAVASCATGTSDQTNEYSDAPIVCPGGFDHALASELQGIQAAAEIDPKDIGLGDAASKIACVVRKDSSASGAQATVIMRAGLSESDVRHAMWDLGFDDDLINAEPQPGEVKSIFMSSYGGLTSEWRGENYSFHEMFPPNTVVLDADLQIPHVLKKCKTNGYSAVAGSVSSTPGSKVVSCRPWTDKEMRKSLDDITKKLSRGPGCRDVTSIDRNWQNDMLCTRSDGSTFYTDYQGAVDFLGYDSTADIGH